MGCEGRRYRWVSSLDDDTVIIIYINFILHKIGFDGVELLKSELLLYGRSSLLLELPEFLYNVSECFGIDSHLTQGHENGERLLVKSGIQ